MPLAVLVAIDASLVFHVDEMRMPMADLARRHDDGARLAFTIATCGTNAYCVTRSTSSAACPSTTSRERSNW